MFNIVCLYRFFEMEIGEKIKNLRTILGLTQEELAERADEQKGLFLNSKEVLRHRACSLKTF